MVFWGVEVNPKKAVKQCSDDFGGGKLHVSQATLGLKRVREDVLESERVLVACKASNSSRVFLCSLIPGVMESCSLDLLFDEDIVFSVIGSHSVHLAGYFLPLEDAELEADESDEDLMFGGYDFDEEESEKDSSDDDSDVPIALPLNTSVKIEEIFDEEPSEKDGNMPNIHLEKGILSFPQQKRVQRAQEDGIQKQDHASIVKVGSADKKREESEDEDGFPLPQKRKTYENVSNKPEGKTAIHMQGHSGNDGTKMTSNQIGASEDEGGSPLPQKRKTPQVNSETPLKKLKSDEMSAEILDSGEKKKKKKKTKNKTKSQAGSSQANTLGSAENVKLPQSMEVVMKQENAADSTVNNVSSALKTPDKKLEKQEFSKVKDGTPVSLNPKIAIKKGTPWVRKYPNGLEVEEISMGKPDGKQAKPGKKVAVHYIGMLKSNGKIFDSCIGKKPFEFRLGVGEVIKGWDVGVNGMRIGDKRKLTIPPQMGYGATGVPGTIPQNAWLVFNLELVNVK